MREKKCYLISSLEIVSILLFHISFMFLFPATAVRICLAKDIEKKIVRIQNSLVKIMDDLSFTYFCGISL